jgi:hypothetical protein
MTFECFSEYQNNPQLFAALVQAFKLGGGTFKIEFNKLLAAYAGESDMLTQIQDKKVGEFALRLNWASATKQLVANGPIVSSAIQKARNLKQVTEATLAAFDLKQACLFRLRRMEEIENSGKT